MSFTKYQMSSTPGFSLSHEILRIIFSVAREMCSESQDILSLSEQRTMLAVTTDQYMAVIVSLATLILGSLTWISAEAVRLALT